MTEHRAEEWATLFYLCGHYDRPESQDPFSVALDEIRAVAPTAQMSSAVYLDLETGAQRIAIREGEPAQPEYLGAVNSGDPETLEQFLAWAFDACPARRYVLVMAGLGILDNKSVVGRPPFDSDRMFAICDDRATDDAIELHELSATLKTAFPTDGPRRLVMLACDMYAMQFMEVAYELRGLLDVLVGIQADERHDSAPVRHWPYARLLTTWQEMAAAPVAGAPPRWRSGIDSRALPLAQRTIGVLSEHYSADDSAAPVTVSAVNLQALGPLAQALDTFSVVFLQWLSNDVIWRARERVFRQHEHVLQTAWSYDLDDVAVAVQRALRDASAEALVRWAADAIPRMAYPRLSAALRALGAAARDGARKDPAAQQLAGEIAACRSAVERVIAIATRNTMPTDVSAQAEVDRAVTRLFVRADDPAEVRDAEAWAAIITAARDRFLGVASRELADAFDGIEAAKQLSRLAGRVSELVRGEAAGEPDAVIDVWPKGGRSGLSLYRPIDLDKLAQSNYLQLRFSRELHWTALLTAIDLIKNHARMLWRLLESQLTAAPLEARYQLMRRLAGARALTGRHADQLQVLSAPSALFLMIEPADEGIEIGGFAGEVADGAEASADPITTYCVRLSSLDQSAVIVEHRNQVTRERLLRLLADIDEIGAEVNADPAAKVQQLARYGSLLGDDLLYGVSDRLADVEPPLGRAPHLVLQMPRELMQFPWELLRDRRGWLVERFAMGRQVIAEGGMVSRWTAGRRHGALRLLVVAPSGAGGDGTELEGVGALEGAHVASCFERLRVRLPGLVESGDFAAYVNTPVTVDDFRGLVREGRYDIVHFAGHGRYDSQHPERSCWLFSDGQLYAFELRHTLANAEVMPWLVYGSACEAGRGGGTPGMPTGAYHNGLYGMASAALGHGVAAYVGPLWKISETDAKNLAAAFYEALLLRRASLGEALALARRSVKLGTPDLDELAVADESRYVDFDAETPVSAGWTGMVLYGDPTPTVLQRLSPSESQ